MAGEACNQVDGIVKDESHIVNFEFDVLRNKTIESLVKLHGV